jgi:GDP-L-fucose synthase
MELDKKIYVKHANSMLTHINVGFGSDVSIAELAQAISNVVGYQGKITFDPSRPDGSPRKWMSSSKLNNLGWRPTINLKDGLTLSYKAALLESRIR